MKLIRFEDIAGGVAFVSPDAVRTVVQSHTETGVAIIRTEIDHIRVRMTPDEVFAALRSAADFT